MRKITDHIVLFFLMCYSYLPVTLGDIMILFKTQILPLSNVARIKLSKSLGTKEKICE
jgi:hypothetical protein